MARATSSLPVPLSPRISTVDRTPAAFPICLNVSIIRGSLPIRRSAPPAGPVRYIPSPDLAPGEKKLVEKPAPGGKTTFTYEVTYPDGQVNQQVFTSEYRPWAETWLVGATTTPETAPASGAN